MNTHDSDLPRIYLKPGEIHFAKTPSLVTTILGSCLSVIMWHRDLQLGVICHGILPRCPNLESCRVPCRARFKYVDCTIHWMIDQLTNQGISPREIEVKLFGGGDLFPSSNPFGEDFRVGKQNTETALSILRAKGLSVGSTDLGGLKGRKIIFNTGNGEVFLKRLDQAGAMTIAQNEETWVVFGMPNEAIKLGGVDKILPQEGIPWAVLKENV